MNLKAIITGILAAIPAVEKILGLLAQYFPPKSPEDRGVEKYKEAVEKYKEENRKLRAAIQEAKMGRTKAIEDILNGK